MRALDPRIHTCERKTKEAGRGAIGRGFESTMKIRALLLALTIFLGACASQQDKNLVEAAGDGDVERMRQLIDGGADVNTVALEWTPLTNAARKGRLGAIELLVASGADVNKGIAGLSPLFWAARDGHVAVVRFLLQKNAKLTFPDVNREKFLAEVKSFNDPELMKLVADQL